MVLSLSFLSVCRAVGRLLYIVSYNQVMVCSLKKMVILWVYFDFFLVKYSERSPCIIQIFHLSTKERAKLNFYSNQFR